MPPVQYQNLPPHLAQQFANLPPLLPMGRGRGQAVAVYHLPIPPTLNHPPAPILPAPALNHLPAHLAQQLEDLLPLAPRRRRGRQADPFPMLGAPVAIPNPAVIPPHGLPLARQSFNRDWQIHSLGQMDVVCTHCHALHWKDERLKDQSAHHSRFEMCCSSGKIQLPLLDQLPNDLRRLLSEQDPRAKAFRNEICTYNNALAMTSIGCEIDRTFLQGGPYVFKIHGRLSHLASSLLPAPDAQPVFAQIYVYDGDEALGYRLGNRLNANLNAEVLRTLQGMFY